MGIWWSYGYQVKLWASGEAMGIWWRTLYLIPFSIPFAWDMFYVLFQWWTQRACHFAVSIHTDISFNLSVFQREVKVMSCLLSTVVLLTIVSCINITTDSTVIIINEYTQSYHTSMLHISKEEHDFLWCINNLFDFNKQRKCSDVMKWETCCFSWPRCLQGKFVCIGGDFTILW